MKKILCLLVLLVMLADSRAQTTCATAIAFTESTAFPTAQTQTPLSEWFSFTSQSTGLNFTLRNIWNSSGDKACKVTLWGGSCSGLTSLASDTLSGSTDSVLSITASVTNNTAYYIQVTKLTNINTISYFVAFDYKLSAASAAIAH